MSYPRNIRLRNEKIDGKHVLSWFEDPLPRHDQAKVDSRTKLRQEMYDDPKAAEHRMQELMSQQARSVAFKANESLRENRANPSVRKIGEKRNPARKLEEQVLKGSQPGQSARPFGAAKERVKKWNE